MESMTDGSRIPRLAEFARIKINSSGLITPKAGWSIRLSQSKVVWWTRPGSNRRPPHCERGALPAELLAHEQQRNFSKRGEGSQTSLGASSANQHALADLPPGWKLPLRFLGHLVGCPQNDNASESGLVGGDAGALGHDFAGVFVEDA